MDVNKKTEIVNARRINKIRWIAGLSMSVLVIVFTVVATILNITNFYGDTSYLAGFGTLRMFTTLSNIIAAVAAFMCLPFQLDGLKRDRYKLPSWIVVLLYVGAVGTFLTFLIALTFLSATQGFVKAMFGNSNLFMHTISPICITALFVLILTDAHIGFRASFLAMIPTVLYCLLYYIMVFALGIWEDHYQANTFVPWPVSLLFILSLAFGIAQGLRALHNLMNKRVTAMVARYYLEAPDFEFPRVSDAVAHLAEVRSKFHFDGDDIDIPVDIIALLCQRYSASIVPLDILYDIYLENYMRFIKKPDEAK